jgi:hypothetical protein
MKKWLVKGLAILNTLEGIIHIGVALIGFWGIIDTETWDWRVLAAPVENFIFGLFSILTGYILGTKHHHEYKKGEN